MVDDTPPTIPPKVTPGAAPGVNKPRPMTIRLKSTKPGAAIPGVKLAKPADPEVPKAEAPAPEPPPAPAAEPVAPAAPEAPVAAAVEPAAEPAPAPKPKASQTSRIHLEDVLGDTTMSGEAIGENPTIKMKPVSSATQNISEEALKEASPEQQQAAKSKTARIALDSVLSGIENKAPAATTQKTIRLKRPGGIPAGGPAASSPSPIAPASTEDGKTIRIKRPGTITLKKSAAPSADEPDLTPIENLDDVAMTPLDLAPIPGKDNKAFSIVAIVACAATLIVGIVTLLCLGNQNFGDNPAPDGNTLYSLKGTPWPWPGK